jgi:predicted PurR-regulated permease PerM
MNQDTLNKSVLVLLLLVISALFLSLIKQFLMAIFLAGLFSALARPVYLYLTRVFGGRQHLASLTTLLLLIVIVLIPMMVLIGIVVAQAIEVGQMVTPWVKQTLSDHGGLTEFLKSLPFYEHILPYQEQIMQKAGQAVGFISKFLVEGLSSATLGTVHFFFMAFVMLYSMFFFFMDGDKIINKMLYYLPLGSSDENRMLEKFTSVTRATLKGTFLIGVLQGGLAGLAFVVVGIPNAVFWGAIMAVLSIIPSVGSALVWLPAAIILVANGQVVGGVGLAIFCGVLVGSLDNLLRPVLVGKDTKLHELMIFFSTLGGIFMFGVVGIFIGPIIASLFVTIWEIYGVAFKDVLPEVRRAAIPQESNDSAVKEK